MTLTALCMMVAPMAYAQQTINLTSANPTYDIGNAIYPITGLTVADNVSGVITGAGGTLQYAGGSPFVLGSITNNTAQNLDMSGLSNFTFNNPTQSFSVGGRYAGSNNGSTNTSAILTLAADSVITTSSFNVAATASGAANAVRNIGTVNLGANTRINADTINVGTGAKTSGTITLAAGGTLVLRGTDGSSPVANWTIGAGGNSSLASTLGNVNLGAGSVDAVVTNLLIGQSGPGGSAGTQGTLTLGSGTLAATSIVTGQSGTGSSAGVTGSLTVNSGGTITAQTMMLGDRSAGINGSATGTLNVNGGTASVQTITLGNGTSGTGSVSINSGGTLQAGTIRSGNTGTINWNNGSIANLADGANMDVSGANIVLATTGTHTFQVNGVNALASVSSIISGNGGTLLKAGSGTLALSGTNTYSGDTTINGGLINFQSLANFGTGNLNLNGGGLQWGTGVTTDVSARLNALGSNGAVFDTNGNNVTLAGNLTGSGGVIKDGAGVLTLTGMNAFTGVSQINSGTLQLGNGGSTGTILGDIVNNAALVVNQTGIRTLPGTISGTGSLTQAGSGVTVLASDNTYTGGTTISAGVLQLGNGGTTGSIVGDVSNNGALVINRSDTSVLPGVISGSGALTQAGSGTTVLTANNTYTGATTVAAGTLQLGNGGTTGSVAGNIINDGTLIFNRADTVSVANQISGPGELIQAGPGLLNLEGAQTYTGPTLVNGGTLAVNGSITSDTTVAAAGTLAGFGSIVGNVINQGTLRPGSGISGSTNYGALTVQGNYTGMNGRLMLNTYLGADGSPSDRLIIDGGAATGSTAVLIHNTNPGAPVTSTGDGIEVIAAVNGGTTTADAFKLAAEVRSGFTDYHLFRGGVAGNFPDNWFLRNVFTTDPLDPEEPIDPTLPPTPPDEILPPGTYPIIGPEIATYGVVQPIARQLGLLALGTLHDRSGADANAGLAPTPNVPGQSMSSIGWGRVYNNYANNRYQAYASPSVKGNMAGFQVGADLWRGAGNAGRQDSAGVYAAFSNANMNVDGLVTNADATGYVRERTGTLNLNAWSGGAYWTHYGADGWYLDAVLQATHYSGSASTQNANLSTNGLGLLGSLETGYGFSLPQFGPGFNIEPQAQLVWQRVRFDEQNDGLGNVALGTTNGLSGRLGLRAKWEIESASGQLWEPSVVTNLWKDWGSNANTVYSGAETAPLLANSSRLELGGGLATKIAKNFSFYSNATYQFALNSADGQKRDGINATVGLRFAW